MLVVHAKSPELPNGGFSYRCDGCDETTPPDEFMSMASIVANVLGWQLKQGRHLCVNCSTLPHEAPTVVMTAEQMAANIAADRAMAERERAA